MTIRGLGKITPMQWRVLELGGFVVTPAGVKAASDDERLAVMRAAREWLREKTNVDLGFDLGAWHALLQDHEEHRAQYCHPYAWAETRRRVKKLLVDPRRLRLMSLLNQDPGAG